MSRPGTTQGDTALAQVLASAPIILFTLDRRGIVTLSEGKGLQALGLAPGEVVGRNVFELYGDLPQIVADLHRALAGEQLSSVSRVGDVYFEVTYSPLHDAKGELTGTIGVATDVTLRQLAKDALRHAHDELEQRVKARTLELSEANAELRREIAERKRAEEELRAQKTMLKSVLDSITDGVAIADKDSQRIELNPAAERILGPQAARWPLDETNPDYGIFRSDEVTRFPAAELPLVRALRGEETEEVEMFVRNSLLPEGLWLSGKAAPLHDSTGAVRGSVAMFRDVTTHKRGEEALKRERRALTNMLRSHERHRQLIAYEVHDGLVQGLAAAVMHLEAAQQGLPTFGGRVRDELGQTLRLLRGSIDEARRLISGLRPPVLDEYGLVAAIDYLIRELPRDQIEIEFVHEVRFDRLDALLEATVFRIIQEALNNIRQHSGAKRARIALTQIGDRIQIEVRDWGRGFDPAVAHENRYGLQGIRERARLLRGSAAVEGSPGKGTRLLVDLPLTYPLETASERGKP
jgi:PAS domain S-box-containing protein